MALTLYRITATKKLVVVDSATPPSGGVAVTAASTTNLVDTAPWTRTLDAATSHVTDWHPAEYPPSTPEMFTSEAQLLSLNSSSQAFTYDGLNVLDPAGQSITFTTKLQNIVDPVVWTSSPVGLLTSTSDAGAILTSANFGANNAVTVTATAGTNSDVISIVRLTDGSTVLVGYLTNESHTLPSDSSGTVSVYTGATGTFKVYYGLTEVTSACTFAGAGVNCAGSVTVAGVYTVSSGIATGTDLSTYTLTATHPTYGAITKVFSISKSKAGVSAVISDLSNDNHTVPTDSSGSNGNFTGCATTMSVFIGSSDDSANWTYAVTKSAGVTCTEAITSRTQTVTAMTTDTGTVTIVASKAGFASQTQVFSISKAKSGVAYSINLSNNSVRKSSAGVLSPTSLTLTASKVDVSGVTAYTGRFKIYLNGSATATYTSAADEASKVYTVTATDATIKCELYLAGGTTILVDTETVLVVADGADGNPGTNGTSVYLATIYKQIASVATPPSGGTYNFNSATLTAPDATWSAIPPTTTTTPTWACEYYFSTTTPANTLTANTWTNLHIDMVKGDTGSQGPSVVVTSNIQASFTATDGTLDASQADIIFTAAVSGVTSPTYVWTFAGFQTSPTNSAVSTQTITAAQFGTSKSAIITCTVSGVYTDKITVVRLEKSTAAANATKTLVYSQATVPSSPNEGDVWYVNAALSGYVTGAIYIYKSSAWVRTADATVSQLGGSGVNIFDPRYATFEESALPPFSTHGSGTLSQDTTAKYFGTKSLKIVTTGIGGYWNGNTGYTTNIQPNKKWIISGYVYSSTIIAAPVWGSAGVHLGIYTPSAYYGTAGYDGNAAYGTLTIPANTWTRIYGVLDLTADSNTTCLLRIDSHATGTTVWFDGIMLEAQVGNLVTPSVYQEPVNFLTTYTGDLGATRNVFKGNWATTISYVIGDVVIDTAGYGWSCILAHTSSVSLVTPTYPTSSNTYWTTYTVKGVDAITILIPNDTHTFSSSSGGVVSDYTNSGTTITIYDGTQILVYDGVGTSNGTWKVVATSSQTASVNDVTVGTLTDSGNFLTVGNSSGFVSTIDNAAITYTITGVRFNGTSFSTTKQQTLSKSKTGIQGADSSSYALSLSSSVISKSVLNVLTPTSSTASIYKSTGTTSPALYAGRFIIATSSDGTTYTDVYTSSADESSKAYTIPTTAKTIRVRAYLAGGVTTLLDEETITIVSDGSSGIDSVNNIVAVLNNENQSIPADNGGTTGTFSAISTMSVYNGAIDDSANWTYTKADSSTTSTISGATATVTALSADTGTVTITATRSAAAQVNILSGSETFDATWSDATALGNTGVVVATSTIPAPNGSLTAKKITANAGLVLFYRKAQTFAASQYSVSTYVYVPTQAGITSWSLSWDFADTTAVTASIPTYYVFDKWVRVEGTATTSASLTFLDWNIAMNSAALTAGTVFHVWGAMCKTGAASGKYIPYLAPVSKVFTLAKAKAGGNGTSINVVELYQQAASAPALPTGTSYDFSTDTLSGTLGSWVRTMPASSTVPTYRTVCTFTVTAPTTSQTRTVWSTAVIVAQNGSNGVGSPGTRGSGEFYVVGSSWTDAAALAGVVAIYPAGVIYGDTVTISNNSNFVMVKYWNGTAWTAPGTVIDGSLIVTNSITAAKINSNGLSIKDASGNIILAAGSALDFSNVGGTTKPANNATVGATFGTDISGQIPVGGASTYIANGALDTLQVKGNAITAMESFLTYNVAILPIPSAGLATTTSYPGAQGTQTQLITGFPLTAVDIATKRIITFSCQVSVFDVAGFLSFFLSTSTSVIQTFGGGYITPNNSLSSYDTDSGGVTVRTTSYFNYEVTSFLDVAANTSPIIYVIGSTWQGRSGFSWSYPAKVDRIRLTSVTGKR